MKQKEHVKRLIWDIETSPNIGFFWRAGYRQTINPDSIIQERAIICICYKWEHSKKVHALRWNNGDDKELLEKFLEVAHQADELIAHNGDKFDIKWFNGRCLYHDLDPYGDWKTVDTLVIARRRFYLNSNRLDYLGKFLFKEGKIHTSFDMWKDIVLKDSKKAMDEMVRYCKQDVELLERVWHRIKGYHKPKTHSGVAAGLDKWTCPYTGSMKVRIVRKSITAAGTIQYRMKSNDANKYYTISEKAHSFYAEWRLSQ